MNIEGIDIAVPMLEEQGSITAIDVLAILDENNNPLRIYDADIKTSHQYNKILYSGSNELSKKIISQSCAIYEFIGGHDFGRSDFKISMDGIPYFLEMAPLPSVGAYSSFCKCANLKGISCEEIYRRILESAQNRY